jgi:isoleucyl-tRNA synthetase
VLWRALHDLAIASSPVIAFTSEEVWQSHPELEKEESSVHFAIWDKDSASMIETEWEELLEIRQVVNAAIEPLRAAKQVATTLQVEVDLYSRADNSAHVEFYARELESFLLVAQVNHHAHAFAATTGPNDWGKPGYRADARPTTYRKCERCWTYRPDVGTGEGAVCGRCAGVLATQGGRAG